MAKKYLSDPQLKSKCSLPIPDKGSFRDGKRGDDAILGWEYLEKLPPELAAIVRCRVYRIHPKIDMRLIGKRTTDIDVWEGPLTFPSGEYDRHFYHTFGAGAYKVIVEEQGLSGVVCDIWFTLKDTESYPPKIDDRTLCLDAPENKDYLNWRALRGDPVGGKPEPETTSGEDDFFMEEGKKSGPPGTAATLVEGLLDLSKSQIGRAEQDAKDAKEEAKEARAASAMNPNLTLVSATESIRLIADTSRDMMKNSGTPDPVNLFKAIVEIMPKPTPPPDNSPMFNMILENVRSSNQTILSMVLDQNKELKTELSQMRQTSTSLVSVDPMQKFAEFKNMAELFGYTKGAAHVEPAAPAKSVMEEWGPIINMAMTMAGPLIQLLVQKLSPGAAQPTANPQQPQQQPQAAAPAQPAIDPNSPQGQELQFLKHIEAAFLTHLFNSDFNGFTFAEWIISGGTGAGTTIDGQARYQMIKANYGIRPDKTCGLDALIQTYPPIWERAKSVRGRYVRFLEEFFTYDEQGEPPMSKAS